MTRGLLFVVTAPSGAGKSSLIAKLLEDERGLALSVSYTTRAPRPGEQNGREYHFVDLPAFEAMLERGEFLESAEVHGHRYGTSQKAIEAVRASGRDLLLEIDWQGAAQVRRLYPESIGIFILPPSMAELERRLRNRGTDSDEVIRRRMERAAAEISHWAEYDYVLINNDAEKCRELVHNILKAERLKAARRVFLHDFVRELIG